jgi:hypothetical protein
MTGHGRLRPMTRRSARSPQAAVQCLAGAKCRPLTDHSQFARPVFSVPHRARCPSPMNNWNRAIVTRQGGICVPPPSEQSSALTGSVQSPRRTGPRTVTAVRRATGRHDPSLRSVAPNQAFRPHGSRYQIGPGTVSQSLHLAWFRVQI